MEINLTTVPITYDGVHKAKILTTQSRWKTNELPLLLFMESPLFNIIYKEKELLDTGVCAKHLDRPAREKVEYLAYVLENKKHQEVIYGNTRQNNL